MSVAAKKWVRRHSLARGSARTVLAELAWAGDNAGRGARLAHGELVAATGLSRRTVQRALAALERDDMIRRHRGGPDHCAACARAQRGVVVFDVVMPEQPPEVIQTTLFDGADAPGDVRHVAQVVTHVSGGDVRHGDAGSGVRVTHLEEERTEGQQQRENARESSNEQVATVERVVEVLAPTRLFVDRYSIEGVVMRHAPAAVDEALTEVVALAGDPAYRLPKGGAAVMLLQVLRRQTDRAAAPAPRFARRPAVEPAGGLPDRFAKYDIAAGLA